MRLTPFSIIILFSLLSVTGFFLFPLLPVKLTPDNSSRSISIYGSYPGAPAELVEREISIPLESTIATIQGVLDITVSSDEGNSVVTILFDAQSDMQAVKLEVATIVRQLHRYLPASSTYPVIYSNVTNNDKGKTLLTYTLEGPASGHELLTCYNHIISPVLNELKTIQHVRINGILPAAINIKYDPDVLTATGITADDITTAIRQHISQQQLGQISSRDLSGFTHQLHLSLTQFPTDIADWDQIPVKKKGNRILRLKDLTTIHLTEEEVSNKLRINGKQALSINILATNNSNYLVVGSRVQALMRTCSPKLPAGYRLTLQEDENIPLIKEVITGAVRFTIIISWALLLTLLFTCHYRLTGIMGLSIVYYLGTSFLIYFLFGLEINRYTITAGCLSIMIHISTVIYRLMNQGGNTPGVVSAGILLAISGALASFWVTEYYLTQELTFFFRVLIINTGVSFLITYFLVPALRTKISGTHNKIFTKKNKWLVRWHHRYLFALYFPSRYRKWSLLIMVCLFAGTMKLFIYKKEISPVFSVGKETALHINITIPKNVSTDKIELITRSFEKYFASLPQLAQFKTVIGMNDARMEISFKAPYQKGDFPFFLKMQVEQKAAEMGLATFLITGVGDGFNNLSENQLGNYSIAVVGYDYRRLCDVADYIRKTLMNNPRVKDAVVRNNDNKREDEGKGLMYYFRFKDQARRVSEGIELSSFEQALNERTVSQTAIATVAIGKQLLPVTLGPAVNKLPPLWTIMNIPQQKDTSTYIRLSDIGYIDTISRNANIVRENQQYRQVVHYTFLGNEEAGHMVWKNITQKIRKELPLGFNIENSGQETKLVAIHQLITGIAVSIITVFMVCCLVFNNIGQSLVIAGTVPLTFTGIFLLSDLVHFDFSNGGYTAFFIWSGWGVNAGMLLLDDYKGLATKFPAGDTHALFLKALYRHLHICSYTTLFMLAGLLTFLLYNSPGMFDFSMAVGLTGCVLFSIPINIVLLPALLNGTQLYSFYLSNHQTFTQKKTP